MKFVLYYEKGVEELLDPGKREKVGRVEGREELGDVLLEGFGGEILAAVHGVDLVAARG